MAQVLIEEKTKTLANYDAVGNALPGYQKVCIANAHCAAYNGASPEELKALVSLDGQYKTQMKLLYNKLKYGWDFD